MTTPPARRGAGHRYDVAIVGAGGCGCEAALRLARSGHDVLLVTTSLDTVFATPAGRVAAEAPTGTLMHELLGELRPDATGTVASWDLHAAAKYRIEAERNVHLLQSSVDGLMLDGSVTVGVETWEGIARHARCVALCVGPFLRARLRSGEVEEHAGRPGEMAYDSLAEDLAQRGVELTEASDAGGGAVGQADGPPWSVRFLRVADEAVDGVRIRSIGRLYAAGICVRGPQPYAGAAADGARLAAVLESDLSGD